MTVNYQIREASPQDVALLAPRVCESDVREVEAFYGSHIQHVLQKSYELSEKPMVFELEGQVMSMWGIAPCPQSKNPRHGLIWLLNAESAIGPHSAAYGRYTKRWIREVLPRYDRLYNYVDIANFTSVEWLKWLGFEMKEHHFIGGRTYWLFENKAQNT